MPKVQKIEPPHYSDAVKKLNGFTGVVLVFHPSCGHCIQLKPNWEQMKQGTNQRVHIMEINGEGMAEHSMLSNSVAGKNTEGFPTIMGLRNGKIHLKFNEERTIPNMVKFANKFISKSILGSQKNKHQKKSRRMIKKIRKTKTRK
jgi:hypothetical protein